MTGEQYYNLDDEVKERMNRKSYFLFKSKHKWRKIEDRLNCGVEILENKFDGQIELFDKKLQLMNKLKEENNNAKALDRKNGVDDTKSKVVVENKRRVFTAIYGRRAKAE